MPRVAIVHTHCLPAASNSARPRRPRAVISAETVQKPGDSPSPILPRWGGGILNRVPVELLLTTTPVVGDFAYLDPSHPARLVRYLLFDETVTADGVRNPLVVVSSHFLAFLKFLPKSTMFLVARQHGVRLTRDRSKASIVSSLEAHLCSPTCPIDRWLFHPSRASSGAPAFIHHNPAVAYRPSRSAVVVTARSNLSPLTSIRADASSGTAGQFLTFNSREPVFPPSPPSLSQIADTARGWCADISPEKLKCEPCAVCGQLVLACERIALNLRSPALSTLLDRAPHIMPDECRQYNVLDVLVPSAVDIARDILLICTQCNSTMSAHTRVPRQSLANGLWLGEVPVALQGLSYVEKLMIARYRHTVIQVEVDSGARKMHGNAVVFSQPVAKFYHKLPPTREELTEVFSILFSGPAKPTESDWKRCAFLARKDRVLLALNELKAHHCDYWDLEISLDNLATYPEHEPPVAWRYHESAGQVPPSTLGVYETDDDRGVDLGDCPISFHSSSPETVPTFAESIMKITALEHVANGGHVLTYGHSEQPVDTFHNPCLYPGMFPWLFPFGRGGFENDSMVHPLAFATHVRWLMLYYDRRFQTDENFVYLAFNQIRLQASSSAAFAMVKRQNFNVFADKLLHVDLDALASLAARGRRDNYVKPETDAERACYELLSWIEGVAGHVPLSGAKKKYQKNEIRSMIYEFGVPIFFITFAPLESNSPICLFLAGEKINLGDPRPLKLGKNERKTRTVTNPVACAQFFNLIVRLFLKHVLHVDDDQPGLFGNTAAYYGTVEQQARLTLHLHLLVWTEASLSPQELRDRCLDTQSMFSEQFIQWLDSCHQGDFSTGSQQDVETRLLAKGRPPYKNSRAEWWPDECLGLPSAPAENASDAELTEWHRDMLSVADEIAAVVNVHDRNHVDGVCRKPPHYHCKGRFPRLPQVSHTQIEAETGAILLKKNEPWINTFNPLITYLIRSNTDVTSLLSGTQVRTVIAYVADYLTKMNLKSYIAFNSAHKILSGSTQLVADSESNIVAARRALGKIVNNLTGSDETGGPMVCAELLKHPDHYTGSRFKVCYWRAYVNHVLAEADDTSESLSFADDNTLTVRSFGQGPVGHNKVHDYIYRPTAMCDMTLYDFLKTTTLVLVRRHRVKKRKLPDLVDHVHNADAYTGPEEFGPMSDNETDESRTDTDTEEDVVATDAYPARVGRAYRLLRSHPLYPSHDVRMLRPKTCFVVNFVGGMLPRKTDTDRTLYCATAMILFKPGGWRTTRDLLGEHSSWEDAYAEAGFSERHIRVLNNMNVLYECQDARDDYAAQRRAEEAHVGVPSFLTEDSLTVMDNDHRSHDVDEDALMGIALPSATNTKHMSKKFRDRLRQMDAMTHLISRFDIEARARYHTSDEKRVAEPDISSSTTFPSRTSHEWSVLVEDARKQSINVQSASQAGLSASDQGNEHVVYERLPDWVDEVEWVDEAKLRARQRTRYLKQFGPIDAIATLVDQICVVYDLNEEQQRAFEITAAHLANCERNPLLMYLGGMAGTGKSRVILAVTTFLVKRGESHRAVLVAPTGTAAALIGGCTYHSLLCFSKSGQVTNVALSKIQDRLALVDILILDEVSLLSCAGMHDINYRLSEAFKLPRTAFAKQHVLFAGDFAQLPPAGRGQMPLYSENAKGHADTEKNAYQKHYLGQVTWHSVITVVLLKKNMRQRGESEQDRHYRTALENMRYGACTPSDVALILTRIVGATPSSPHIGMPGFRNESIACGRNAHRDAINTVSVRRFATETGRTLHVFYASDTLTNRPQPVSFKTSVRQAQYTAASLELTDDLRDELRKLPPACTEHVPGTLALCEGLPVLIKENIATELSVTNGAEGFVVGWDAITLPDGKKGLRTVFVRIKNPRRPFVLDGLPENVVPIVSAAHTVTCTMPDDGKIRIVRRQVWVLPNFAMTDFAVQGRTRPHNPVDLVNVRGHQAVYTCLSRSSTLDGTSYSVSLTQTK